MYKRYLKRIFDLIFSIVGLIVLSPLFLLLVIAIKVDSRGAVLFKQKRLGFKGKAFDFYKFRSMCVGAEKEGVYSGKGDARVTKVGAFLRKSSLDELPQLLNVLIGEMAIVGPRPHAIPMNKEFAEKIENFMCRHMVKPGITGLAQSKGYRGEINDSFDMNARLRYDLFYIKNWSFFLDIKIILWTFKSLIFKSEKAY
jgi:putative colanic acid biosynthesis UDP-glucose lipid carrier transferase